MLRHKRLDSLAHGIRHRHTFQRVQDSRLLDLVFHMIAVPDVSHLHLLSRLRVTSLPLTYRQQTIQGVHDDHQQTVLRVAVHQLRRQRRPRDLQQIVVEGILVVLRYNG